MIKTIAITPIKNEPMMVTWDLGRRCNYDCTYCESTRHNNHSPHHSIDELSKTFEFIKQWTDVYNNNRKNKSHITLNFTGGEPTVNPAFWSLAEKIKQNDNFVLTLTTNGAWNKKFTEKIIKDFSAVTVSYHAEAHESLKKQVIENILRLKESGIWLQVNVMLHMDYWDECIEVYNLLKNEGIKVKPRPIGDGNALRTGWFQDADGKMRRTSHPYKAEQQTWFWNEMGVKTIPDQKLEGNELGRGCCGGRCLQGKINDQWQDVKLVDTNFKDWYCMVDWYFLHIDQHTGLIYHHQTCQALHNKQKGAIGLLSESSQIIEDLKQRMKNPTPIICPNQRCGCGMCAPKAKNLEDFTVLWENR